MWQSTMIISLEPIEEIDEKWASTLGIAISFSAVGGSILIATFMEPSPHSPMKPQLIHF